MSRAFRSACGSSWTRRSPRTSSRAAGSKPPIITMAAIIAENAGNDYLLSYMSAEGGWGLLDYGLNFATNATDYLRLGYGSILSSWATMNSGTPASNYGFWYPGAATMAVAAAASNLRPTTHLARRNRCTAARGIIRAKKISASAATSARRRRFWPTIRSSAASAMVGLGNSRRHESSHSPGRRAPALSRHARHEPAPSRSRHRSLRGIPADFAGDGLVERDLLFGNRKHPGSLGRAASDVVNGGNVYRGRHSWRDHLVALTAGQEVVINLADGRGWCDSVLRDLTDKRLWNSLDAKPWNPTTCFLILPWS